jgi:hypothetical protein
MVILCVHQEVVQSNSELTQPIPYLYARPVLARRTSSDRPRTNQENTHRTIALHEIDKIVHLDVPVIRNLRERACVVPGNVSGPARPGRALRILNEVGERSLKCLRERRFGLRSGRAVEVAKQFWDWVASRQMPCARREEKCERSELCHAPAVGQGSLSAKMAPKSAR